MIARKQKYIQFRNVVYAHGEKKWTVIMRATSPANPVVVYGSITRGGID
jgi:hypothetical protein